MISYNQIFLTFLLFSFGNCWYFDSPFNSPIAPMPPVCPFGQRTVGFTCVDQRPSGLAIIAYEAPYTQITVGPPIVLKYGGSSKYSVTSAGSNARLPGRYLSNYSSRSSVRPLNSESRPVSSLAVIGVDFVEIRDADPRTLEAPKTVNRGTTQGKQTVKKQPVQGVKPVVKTVKQTPQQATKVAVKDKVVMKKPAPTKQDSVVQTVRTVSNTKSSSFSVNSPPSETFSTSEPTQTLTTVTSLPPPPSPPAPMPKPIASATLPSPKPLPLPPSSKTTITRSPTSVKVTKSTTTGNPTPVTTTSSSSSTITTPTLGGTNTQILNAKKTTTQVGPVTEEGSYEKVAVGDQGATEEEEEQQFAAGQFGDGPAV